MSKSMESFINLLKNYDDNSCQEAFDKHLVEAKKLSSDEFSPSLPKDMAVCLSLGLHLQKQAEKDKDALEALPRVEKGMVEKMASIRLALWQAEINVALSITEGRKIQAVQTAQKLRVERKRFFGAADYIWADDPIVQEKLDEIRKGSGYADLANDGQALVKEFRERKDDVKDWLQESKLEELLSQMDKLSQSLQDLRATKGSKSAKDAAEDDKIRIYTLYQRLYDELARGGRYLYDGKNEEVSELYAPLYSNYLRQVRAQNVTSEKETPVTAENPS